jgi:integrase
MKSRKPHVVPLSDPVIALLEPLPRFAGSDLIFSPNGKNPVNGFAKTKVRLDDLIREKLGRLDHPFVWHDLRRSAISSSR